MTARPRGCSLNAKVSPQRQSLMDLTKSPGNKQDTQPAEKVSRAHVVPDGKIDLPPGQSQTKTLYASLQNGTEAQSLYELTWEGINFAGGLLWPRKSWLGIDTTVDPFLRTGSVVAVGIWILGILLVYTLCPSESFEYLDGAERTANMAVLTVLLCTNTSRFLHLVIRDRSFVFVNTGVMVGSMTVQLVAIVSITMMVTFPTPVLVDPVTGLRSHMVRWVEWVVLAFLMTFLTESIDMPLKDSGGPLMSWIHGIAIALSTAAGAIFPFCQSWGAWLTVFTISWILFCSIFFRLHGRYHRFQKMTTDGSFDMKEEYERAKYSLKTIAVCAVVWTLLATSFSVIAILKPLVAEDSFFASESLVLVTESIFEIISKVWYLNLLIEVHNIVFDDASRTMRRLEELRAVMSTIWNASSDVMVWCSSEGGTIHAVISPSFFDLSDPPSDIEKLRRLAPNYKKPTLVLEIEQDKGVYVHHIIRMNMGCTITRQDAVDLMMKTSQKAAYQSSCSTSEKNVEALAKLLLQIFRSEEKEMVLMTDMHRTDQEKTIDTKIACEAKISKLDASCLVVLRDISERFQRFETEKKLVEEITARKKDSEANRFTRHEVKNSILAAIGVLESMRGTSKAKTISQTTRPTLQREDSDDSILMTSNHSRDSHSVSGIDFQSFEDHAVELDHTLRTVLDTIMDHTTSREVIYEEYEVRKERVMVTEVLSKILRHSNSLGAQFALKAFPSEFPILGIDPRLLRYIYQNALSNACRYGKRGGPVETCIYHESKSNEFRMEVVNYPGVGYKELLEFTHEEVQEKVFSPGSRLHSKCREMQEISESNSSGDGAWIMKKCASMLQGDCEIRFEPDRTIFAFWCPAKEHRTKEFREPELTSLPTNTWGVVIDDSAIQRKLMDRYLKIAGVEQEKRVVVGKNASEIYGFKDMVIKLVQSHPNDKFLIIADENLDVVEGAALHGTVSGSLCLQKMLDHLDPADSARVLALVRSANDSAKETDLYKSRAHGYLVKAPIEKNDVLKAIQPWWFKRFPPLDEEGSQLFYHQSSGSLDLELYDPFVDIQENLEVLSALSSTTKSSFRKRWQSIQERLQKLKGDLKSTIPRGGLDLKRIIHAIDKLRVGGCPEKLQEEWRILQQAINELLDSQRSNYECKNP